jgi:hypothetical protein
MELRELTTDYERQIFAKCLTKARATRGIGWRETARSRLGSAHLAFGDLYALFEKEGEPAEQMKGGFAAHDLASLPPSLPKPDLTHLPAQYVLEGGELWSLSPGIGSLTRRVAAAVAGLRQAKAVVIYSMLRPADITHFYAQEGYVNACEPVEWPYAETSDGGKIWVQPMILEGQGLQEYIRSGFECLFQNSDGRRALRFNNPRALDSPQDRPASRSQGNVSVKRAVLPSKRVHEANGAASQ